MIKRLTRSVLVAAVVVGLCHSMSSHGLVYAQEGCESCESTAISDYGAESYVSDMEGYGPSDMEGYGPSAHRLRRLHGQHQPGAWYCNPWQYGNQDLFYNFYAPNYVGAVPAQLYVAPRPVPGSVGHTYVTYQPLMPHEFTYPHHRTYRKWYDCGRGMNRTKVTWYCEPVTTALHGIRNAVRLPR